MLTKSRLWSYGWTLNFSKNRKITSPNPSQKRSWKSVAQHVLTQPLKTVKSGVWFKRNPSFQLSSFAATWLEKCFQVPPFGTLWPPKRNKITSQDSSQNQRNKHCEKLGVLMKNGVLVGLPVWLFFYVVALCSDPGLPSPPKRSTDPKKVEKWHPTSDKITSEMTHFS